MSITKSPNKLITPNKLSQFNMDQFMSGLHSCLSVNSRKYAMRSLSQISQFDNFPTQITELGLECITHRVISDRVHRLLVTLSYFRPDRFVQLLSLIPILILLLYYLVSGCLTSLC